jgi:hemerythrin superfamily protein
MDAITLLKADHKTVERLFKRFEKAGDRAHRTKRDIVDRIIEELSVHAAVEEQLFYPAARAAVPETEDLALESLEEHHVVKWILSELERMSPEAERFDAKVSVLIENVRHHVEEEESDFFPKVRDALGRTTLNDLGEAMEAAKKTAPTHPHPRSPDTPPGNVVVGAAAGVADRVTDTVSGLAQGGVTAVGEVVNTILRRPKPNGRATGSKTARKTAQRVRSNASDATEAATDAARKVQRGARTARATGAAATSGAKQTARSAQRGAGSTVKAAKSGAKGTATSARKSTRRAATTAKRGATTTRRTARTAAKRTATTARRSAAKTRRTATR